MSNKKEASAVEAVYEYLRLQNRPYSVNDIVLNLHKEHGKTAVQKALEKLVQDEKVREKTYGKQKVYLVNQSGIAEASTEQLKQMEEQIEAKEKRVKELEASMKEAVSELNSLSSSMTTEEASALVQKLTDENAELESKYKELSASTAEVMEEGERIKLTNERNKSVLEWRKRRRICMEALNSILEDWPGTKESLFEEIGIETDEEAGVALPPL